MNLDWVLVKAKPRPGREAEWLQLRRQWKETKDRPTMRRAIASALKDLSITAYEEIGAPLVDETDEARQWFREQVYEPTMLRIAEHPEAVPLEYRVYWALPYGQILRDHADMPVLELARERGGFAKIIGPSASPLDFRGQHVALAKHLRVELREEAWTPHEDPKAALRYALDLEAAAQQLQGDEADDVEAAGRWMRFWAERGFGWKPWW